MRSIHLVILVSLGLILAACGDDEPASQSTTQPQVSTSNPQNQGSSQPRIASVNKSTGEVSVNILPENPTSTGCLRAVIRGVPGVGDVVWRVNGEIVSAGTSTRLCNDHYKRDDQVSVSVGSGTQRAQTSVSIENSPPRVVEIASEAVDIFAGMETTIIPVAEDADGDDVDFSYQWLINGDADPQLTEATLPAGSFKRGDTVQVLIVPNDFYVDGPTYESMEMVIFNAPPRITSQPPQEITSLDYIYQVEVEDPDDAQHTFRLDEAPDGMTIDETTGRIHWSLIDVTPGDYTIAIIVADPQGVESAQEYTLTLGEPQ